MNFSKSKAALCTALLLGNINAPILQDDKFYEDDLDTSESEKQGFLNGWSWG